MPTGKSQITKHENQDLKQNSFLCRRLGFIPVLLFLFWSLNFTCYAAPCYGTKMPKQKSFFCGVQTYSIFKRYLENEYGKVRSWQDFLLLSYGACDWLSIDLKGGAGYIKQHPVGSDELDYPSAFAGGYGFRLKLYDKEKSRIVLGFQHISVHPKKIELGNVKHQAVLDDWQYSLLFSHDLGKLSPYLGGRWSRVDYIHRVDESRKRIMSDLTKSLGLVIGLDIPLNEKTWINLEGELFDSEAASISLNFSF